MSPRGYNRRGVKHRNDDARMRTTRPYPEPRQDAWQNAMKLSRQEVRAQKRQLQSYRFVNKRFSNLHLHLQAAHKNCSRMYLLQERFYDTIRCVVKVCFGYATTGSQRRTFGAPRERWIKARVAKRHVRVTKTECRQNFDLSIY